MSDVDLYSAADDVDSKESFLAFLAALEADWYDRPEQWENGTVPDFLSACRRWAESTSGLTGEPMVGGRPSWAAFANILHAGKFYE
jgi:hypothetical protein